MIPKVALVGSGPTALYCLAALIQSGSPLSITLYERQAVAGRGMPYSEEENSPNMLANIASIEIPPLVHTLADWLRAFPAAERMAMGVPEGEVDERAFYPRLLLGSFFEDQMRRLLDSARAQGHRVEVLTRHEVTDAATQADGVLLTVREGETDRLCLHDFVVLATGHQWPDEDASHPGYLPSPWPAEDIARIPAGRVGVLGTSLSALDVASEVARVNGLFYRDEAGTLLYRQAENRQPLTITLMSRKGVLPEADFHCPLPAEPSPHFDAGLVEALAASGEAGLLDRAFAAFWQGLVAEDADYAASLGLLQPSPEAFAEAYFASREGKDPLVHAARNLAEAVLDHRRKHTVPWRYYLLRSHETFGDLVPAFSEDDAKRFSATLKAVFADNYATVPHLAIERLLALANAGCLEVLPLGDDYEMHFPQGARGAVIQLGRESIRFDTLVDATGQKRLTLKDLPFPALRGELQSFETEAQALPLAEDFSLPSQGEVESRIYCLSLPYLLDRFPFVQGITSSRDLGEKAARSIRERIAGAEGPAVPASLIIAA